jgi:hypothetical protein
MRTTIAALKIETEKISEKLEGFKSGGIELISEETLNLCNKDQILYANHWKKIKRECRDIIEAISE